MPNGYIPILGKPVEKCPQGHALFLLLPLVEKRGGEYVQALTPTGTPSAGVLCWGCLCDVMHAVVTEMAERKASDAEAKTDPDPEGATPPAPVG